MDIKRRNFMNQFKDAKFMTAVEKAMVWKQWKAFIAGGFQWKHFTERIYKHLSLHCSFIAHYSRAGFYDTYFSNPEDTIRFVSQFDGSRGCISVEYGMDFWLKGEYEDLNQSMCEAIEPYKESIYQKSAERIRDRDLTQARSLLAKHGLAKEA